MVSFLVAIIIAFISTNIDDIAVLMILYARADSRKTKAEITVGQFIGIAVITAVSALAAAGFRLLPGRSAGLLGFVPIALGIKEIVAYRKNSAAHEEHPDDSTAGASDDVPALTHGLLSATLITIADGGDNLGIYIPLFTGGSVAQILIACAVFLVMTVIWCVAANMLAGRELVKTYIKKYGHIIVPAVYLVLGVCIIVKAFV